MYNDNLPSCAMKICAGIVEGVESGEIHNSNYIAAVEQAGQVVGHTYAPEAEAARQRLLQAIKLNLTNRKEYPIELLRRRLDFVESERQFNREKRIFCAAMVRRLEL